MLRFSSSCTMSVESRFFNIPRIIDWPFEVEHLDAILLLSKAPDLRYGDVIPMPTRLIQHVGPLAFLVPISDESQTLRRYWWAEPYGSIGAWDGDRQCGSEPTLIDCDAIGLVCRPCLDRFWPPHLESVQKLIGPSLNGDSNLAHVISEFAYPVCTQPFRGFCCTRQPYWVGWTCPLCARVATGAVAGEGIYSNWYQGRMWGNGVGHWTNRGGWGITSGSDWQSGRGDRRSGSAGWQWGYWRL